MFYTAQVRRTAWSGSEAEGKSRHYTSPPANAFGNKGEKLDHKLMRGELKHTAGVALPLSGVHPAIIDGRGGAKEKKGLKK